MQGREFSCAGRSVPLAPPTKMQGFHFVGSFFPNIMELGQENEISNSPCGFFNS